LPKQPTAHPIQLSGTTPVERGRAVCEQLRYHGIPGGIVGEPKGLVTMFVNACENLLRDNQQARILWLVPSNKKGFVTRTIKASTISSYVMVASLVTLNDDSALISRSWTLVIFQGLHQWLDAGPQSQLLSQLKWQWALTAVTTKSALSPSIMQVLHLPERHYKQFCSRYLFDLESSDDSAAMGKSTPAQNIAQPASPSTIELNQQRIAKLHEESEQLQERLTVEDEGQTIQPRVQPEPPQPNLGPGPTRHARTSQFVMPGFIDTRYKARETLAAITPVVQLSQESISKLRAESAQLQERLLVEREEAQEQSPITPTSEPVPVTPIGASEETGLAPEVDEDWQIILQRWQPEHWEIIILLYQEQYTQLTTVERRIHRPVSRLIDEINLPVDEQLGDLLIDPDTQTIFNHLHATVTSLVRWYHSSISLF
jgi:hypothetical protein